MDLKAHFETAEDAIKTLGIDPDEARCDDAGQWLIRRGETEIYIDIWQPTERSQWEYFKDDEPIPVFQVVSPICFLPEDPQAYKQFLEEILHINFHMFYGSFTMNFEEKVAVIRFRRLLDGLNRVEMIEPIESIGFYAASLIPYLTEKYQTKKIA